MGSHSVPLFLQRDTVWCVMGGFTVLRIMVVKPTWPRCKGHHQVSILIYYFYSLLVRASFCNDNTLWAIIVASF
jgi:hypothetical protein